MKNQCCYWEFLASKEDMLFIRLMDITYYPMNRKVRGFGFLVKEHLMPCEFLRPDGCLFDLEGREKPQMCQDFPVKPEDVSRCPDCSYEFKDGKRTGECNQCQPPSRDPLMRTQKKE